MSERRLESRLLCADLVRVDWMTAEDEFRTGEAVLEDISEHGACVQIEEQIPVGTTIAVSQGDIRLYGQVSYCLFRDYGYFVGIRLSDQTAWSTGVFAPRHLTDPRELRRGGPKPSGAPGPVERLKRELNEVEMAATGSSSGQDSPRDLFE